MLIDDNREEEIQNPEIEITKKINPLNKNMKYAFLGNPRFAEIILKKLIKNFQPPEVLICNPDKPTGRKKIITPPETKVLAQEHGIKIYQPEKLTLEDWKKNVSDIDVCVVSAYGKIIPDEIIQSVKFGFIGVHPSLLPRFRGPTPIQSVILEGEEKTGTTLYLIDKEVDHGPIIIQKELLLNNENYLKLEKKLANLSAELLINDLPNYLSGEIKPKEQNHKEATFTNKFSSKDVEIDFNNLKDALLGDKEKSIIIDKQIRALNPEPGTWVIPNDDSLEELPENKRVKIISSEIKEDKLILNKTQVAGKKPKNYKNEKKK
ncbi:MAG: methionyl-tRNA formyltransferase [Candidatus Paceibacterota bacterium]